MKNRNFKKQLPRNLIVNLVSFTINVLIGLWLVPYLINYLGNAAYGLIPLAMVFTEYISVITVSINGSVTRFLTIDIQNQNWEGANYTFNTALFALFVLVCVQVLLLAYITIDIASIISIPEQLVYDAYYLFGFSFSGYLISLFSSVFSTSMYANNRLDLIYTVNILRIITRVLIIVALFIIFRPSLKYVGIANFIGACVSFIYSKIYWRKLTPNLVVSYKFFRRDILRKISSMGGWLVVNQVGYLLFLKIDLVVVNHFIGAEAGGEYAAVQQWNSLIRTMVGILSGVIGPMILISYANGKLDDVIKFAKIGIKFISIVVAILTGVICGFASELLSIWLGKEYLQFSFLLIVMLSHLVINLGALPLLPINTALNKVKIPGIVTIIMGIANLLVSIIFIKYTNLGLIGVALAGAIVLTLKNGIFSPWYASRILKLERGVFFKKLVGGIIVFFIVFLISNFISHLFIINTWIELLFFSFFIAIVNLIWIWIVLLKKHEKNILFELLPFVKSIKVN